MESTQSDATMVYLKILFSHSFGEDGENHEKPCQGSGMLLSVHRVL